MRKLFFLCILFLTLKVNAQSRDSIAQLADSVSEWLTSDRTDNIVLHFDSIMKRSISASQLSDVWQTTIMSWGPLVSKEKIVIDQREPYHLTSQVFNFNRTKFRLTITFNAKLQIIGLYVRPGTPQYEVPNYVNTLNFVEYKLHFGKEPILLEGILSKRQKSKPMPVVIIVQGSGPQDEDGSYGSNKIYKDLAWGIASHDIAVFRYPKRTSIYGSIYLSGNAQIPYTLEDEYITDLKAAIQLLSKRSDIDTNNIFLLGHSQGGDAAVVAAKATGKIKGIIMAATTPRKIQELMCEQLDYINGYEPSYSDKRIKSDAMKARLVYSLRPELKETDPFDSLPLNIAPSYWMYLNKLNLIDTLQAMPELKLLFLQGNRDYQVTTVDFGLWKDAFGNSTRAQFKTYPHLNHMFFKGYGRSTAVEYDEIHNVDEEIVSDIVKWLQNNTQ